MMDISNLKKDELLKLRENIDSQLKYIDEFKKQVKKSKEKNKLSDLDKGDKIFCVNFYGDRIYQMDFVDIEFYKNDKSENLAWTYFSTSHKTKNMGCSASVRSECMDRHFFMSDFTSTLYFFTLKPESIKQDLQFEMDRHIQDRRLIFDQSIVNFRNSIDNFINSNNIDLVINLEKSL